MEMLDNFSSPAQAWFEKAPSPTGSDDSGLGWSPNHLSSDCSFQLDSTNNNACFNYLDSESTCSPQSQIDASEFSPFNQEQKPVNDVCELLEILDQNPDDHATKQQNKKTLGRPNPKKRTSNEGLQNSKLERCFQPKTGNGKPRQTSVKRKPSQKTATAYPYPGVRVETVREKLRKMREGKGGAQNNQSVASTIQSLNTIANGFTNQSYPISSPNPMLPQYQQSYNSFQQHPQDVYTPSPQQTAFPQAPMVSPMPHNSPSYSGPVMSPSTPYELSNSVEAYQPSLPSSSPSRSATCSPFQQGLPSSPEMSPAGIQTASIPSPGSQYSETNYQSCGGYENEQVFNCNTSNYGLKQNSVDDFSQCGMPYQQFNNNSQFIASGVRDLVQSVCCGNVQQLRTIFARNRELVNTRDETGKALIFHAIESRQVEAVKLLLSCQVNLNVMSAEGNTILHSAAACPKIDVLVHLLQALQQKDPQILLCKATNKKGSTPLHLAAEANLINNFIQLLRFGSNYLAQDCGGNSPFHIVVRNANVMAVRALLEVATHASHQSGAKKLKELTSQHTMKGNTALHYAAELHCTGEEGQRNQFEIFQLLLLNGADPLAVNLNGKSPKSLVPQTGRFLQMIECHLMQNASRGYPTPEMNQFQMGCVPTNQYNGAVFPHFQ